MDMFDGPLFDAMFSHEPTAVTDMQEDLEMDHWWDRLVAAARKEQ